MPFVFLPHLSFSDLCLRISESNRGEPVCLTAQKWWAPCLGQPRVPQHTQQPVKRRGRVHQRAPLPQHLPQPRRSGSGGSEEKWSALTHPVSFLHLSLNLRLPPPPYYPDQSGPLPSSISTGISVRVTLPPRSSNSYPPWSQHRQTCRTTWQSRWWLHCSEPNRNFCSSPGEPIGLPVHFSNPQAQQLASLPEPHHHTPCGYAETWRVYIRKSQREETKGNLWQSWLLAAQLAS